MLSLSEQEKDAVWAKYEKEKEIEFLHEIYDGYRYNPSLEEAFDPTNPNCITYTWNEDHCHYMESIEQDEIAAQRNQYHFEEHHLNVNETPYWKNCVNNIEKALNK